MSLVETGRGRPLVFLHGVGGDAESFRPQLEAFSSRYRCLAWNMPGYGGAPLIDLWNAGALALALQAALDDADIDRAHLVGHSLGGMVLQELALRAPERIGSMILFATSPSFGGPDSERRKRFLAERLAPLDAGIAMADLAPALVTTLVSTHADPQGVRQAVLCMARVPADSYRAAIHCLTSFDRRDALADLNRPALCLAGEVDRIAPPAMMERMSAKMPNAQFAVIRRAGHLAQLEQPRAFNAILAAFLADQENTV